ncbi:hypothetical protein LPTSP4_12920 [Leptospira ryugenii]|uniref:Tetratricopeptide repeat protein n=1 Tax=Leptospira ryugenii TaxID=1917863 RepID=A0A2P2DYT0_9LEPT|nr:hypothetical protein LPTSP4_12920 [Leptospira ryugenii]
MLADNSFDEKKFPSVAKLLRATQLADKRSIILNWDPPKDEGEVIIARSNSMIDTAEKLFIADSLGRYKSGGPNGAKSFYDYNLKPGTYYYAVALVSDIRKREVKLFANQNYTITPIVIEETETNPSISNTPDFDPLPLPSGFIRDIQAISENNFIRISWNPPARATAGRTIYTIYRSNSPLTTLPLMQKATKLAEVGHPTNSFLDQSLEKSQTVYYGVSVKEGKGEETLPLVDKESTIRVFYVRNKNSDDAEVITESSPVSNPNPNKTTPEVKPDPPGTLHVRGIGYERVGKGVVMTWLGPEVTDGSTVYSVYASTRPFNAGTQSFGPGMAVKVASINHPKTSFYIKELKPIEDLYFGVTVKSSSIDEDFNLSENVSYFRFDFDKDLVVPSREEVAKQEQKPNETEKKQEVVSNQSYVAPVDLKLKDEESISVQGTHSQSTVVFDTSDSDLDLILRETFMKKKFELAVYQLESYIKREKHGHLLGKAYLFLGISHSKLGDQRKALKYLQKNEAKSFSPERTDFWTNQVLEKLSRGKS